MTCGCEGTKCELEPGDDRHGTRRGYTHRGCRCDTCRKAKREYAKAYYEINSKARREWQKAYRKVNCEALRDSQKARREVDREAYREREKAYRKSNPDVYRAAAARRRAREVNALIGPAFTRQQVWERDGGACHICGELADPGDWHMDHIQPLARGGAHSFGNCAVSHPRCNLFKGARLLDELELHI